jgi:hypothetical protein
MYLIILLTIIVNIAAIVGLLIGLFYKFEQPKNKAIFGYSIVGSMILYVILLGLVVVRGWILKPDFNCVIQTLCVFSPFVIGKLVRYETLKKYTIIQIMFFVFSLITLLII